MKTKFSKALLWTLAVIMLLGTFPIATLADTNTNYARQLQLALYFFDANMCGGDVGERNSDNGKRSALTWRGDCHLQDSNISVPDYFDGGTIDLSGGYHDAGDHVKFNLPIAFSGATLGWAYYEFKDAFTGTGTDAHMRRILDHFAEYFRKCTIWNSSGTAVIAYAYQVGQGGSVIPDGDHSYWGPPELQTGSQRGATRHARFTNGTYAYPGTDQLGIAAAMLAANYVNFGNPEDLRHAQGLYQLAYSNRAEAVVAQAGGTHTSPSDGYYRSLRWQDKMALAAEWLFIATGESIYIAQSNGWTTGGTDWPNSWDGVWANVMALRAQRDQVQWSAVRNPYMNRVNPTSSSYVVVGEWGTARYNTALQLVGLVYDKYNTDQYAEWAHGQMQFLLGNNSISRTEGSAGSPTCFVFGCCSSSITRPHHRAATGFTGNTAWNRFNDNEAPLNVLVGTLAGGPTSASGSLADRYNTYQTAEMACDYQANFIGALAGLYLRNQSHQTVSTDTIPGYRSLSAASVSYTVTYELNGGSGTAPTQADKAAGEMFQAAEISGITAPPSHVFKEWNTQADGNGTAYAPGAAVTMSDNDLTLYAIWEIKVCQLDDPDCGDPTCPVHAFPHTGLGDMTVYALALVLCVVVLGGLCVGLVFGRRRKA